METNTGWRVSKVEGYNGVLVSLLSLSIPISEYFNLSLMDLYTIFLILTLCSLPLWFVPDEC